MSAPVCDFCNGGEATYALPCDNLAAVASGAYGTAVAALSGAWNACADCLPFIQRGDHDGLADSVARAGHGPPELLKLTSEGFRRDVFKALYRKVLPWLGSPQPLAREAAAVGVGRVAQAGRKP